MSSTGRIVCPVESFGSFNSFGTGGILMTTGVMVGANCFAHFVVTGQLKMVSYVLEVAVKVGGIMNPCIAENIIFDAWCFSFEFPSGSNS